MRRTVLGLMCVGLLFVSGGCAGLAADLAGYDLITATVVEAKKGFDAYDTALRADAVKRRANLLAVLKRDLTQLAQANLPPVEAVLAAEQGVALLAKNLDDMAEQERRRQTIYDVTSDNLLMVAETVESMRKLSIFRADIEQQWKDYINVVAKGKLAKASTVLNTVTGQPLSLTATDVEKILKSVTTAPTTQPSN